VNTLRILRTPDVLNITGLSRAQIERLEKRGEFPARVKISKRASGWRSDEVAAWIESRPRAAEKTADGE
jgi:prophage regulatory protein